MWGCNYLPFSGRCGGGFFIESFWPLLIWGLAFLLIVYLATRIFKSYVHNSPRSSQDRIDSLAILKVRFARGEISQEEFIKMKHILSQP